MTLREYRTILTPLQLLQWSPRKIKFALKRYSILERLKEPASHLSPRLGILKVTRITLRTLKHHFLQIVCPIQQFRNGSKVLVIASIAGYVQGVDSTSALRSGVDR